MTIEAIIARRLAEAREELKQIERYRYALVNDVLDQAVREMRAIVLCERNDSTADDTIRQMAVSCRTDSASPRLREALLTFSVD
jgi:guanylate kinase